MSELSLSIRTRVAGLAAAVSAAAHTRRKEGMLEGSSDRRIASSISLSRCPGGSPWKSGSLTEK